MTKEIMNRSSAENRYFHPDFHGALSNGLEYLESKYGKESVREYLRQFTREYYRPVMERLRKQGLNALKEHFEEIYRDEGGEIAVESSPDELLIRVIKCPAVAHMKKQGYKIAGTFSETTRTVNETLCEGSDFTAEMLEYDEETGKSSFRIVSKRR